MLTIKDVTYGYSYHRPILEEINLDISKGEFLGLVGPSGSGKTTLLKIMIGLIKPWHGYIEFCGKAISRLNHPRTGYVPQVESVDWNFPVTVEEVVATGIWNQSGKGPWISNHAKSEVNHVLDKVGLQDHENRQIRELSGGEQQRVFLARALIRKPDILVLDEPTSGVDYSAKEKILNVLRNLNEDGGITIVITTHDIVGIAKRLPRTVCLNRKILADGKPEYVLTTENLLKLYGLEPISEG